MLNYETQAGICVCDAAFMAVTRADLVYDDGSFPHGGEPSHPRPGRD